jgi:hypothetical protein
MNGSETACIVTALITRVGGPIFSMASCSASAFMIVPSIPI